MRIDEVKWYKYTTKGEYDVVKHLKYNISVYISFANVKAQLSLFYQ